MKFLIIGIIILAIIVIIWKLLPEEDKEEHDDVEDFITGFLEGIKLLGINNAIGNKLLIRHSSKLISSEFSPYKI